MGLLSCRSCLVPLWFSLSLLFTLHSSSIPMVQDSITDPGFSAEPVLPAFCRLAFDFAGFNNNRRKFGRFFAGWKVLLVFVFAGWRSLCLSKTAQRVGALSFPSFFLLKRATGSSSSCLKAHLLSLSVQVGQLRDDHESRADACRASDAECPEALPVYSVLHVACSRGLAARRWVTQEQTEEESAWHRWSWNLP